MQYYDTSLHCCTTLNLVSGIEHVLTNSYSQWLTVIFSSAAMLYMYNVQYHCASVTIPACCACTCILIFLSLVSRMFLPSFLSQKIYL